MPTETTSETAAGVTAVIVSFNKKDYLLALLRSLSAGPMDGLQILIVDNASEDGTPEAVEEIFGDTVEILRLKKNTGGSGGFNTGMSHALANHDSEFLWLLDNDVTVRPDTLTILRKFMTRNLQAGAVGSAMIKMGARGIVNEAGGTVDWKMGRLVHHFKDVSETDLPIDPFEVDYCAAASLLVRRETVKETGLMKDYFIHFDDVEWCLRMRDFGWSVFTHPLSRFEHESYEFKPVTWIRYYDTRNLLFLYRDREAPGLKRRLVKLKLLHFHMRMMGLGVKAKQIAAGITDFHQGIMGGRDTIPTQVHYPLENLPFILKETRYHFVAADGPKLIELAESLRADISGRNLSAIVYHAVDADSERKLVCDYNLRLFDRKHGILGIPCIVIYQLYRRIVLREQTVIHHEFTHRRCLPLRSKRYFVHPKGQIFFI